MRSQETTLVYERHKMEMIHGTVLTCHRRNTPVLEQQELVAQREGLMKVRMKYMEAQNTEYVDEMCLVSR